MKRQCSFSECLVWAHTLSSGLVRYVSGCNSNFGLKTALYLTELPSNSMRRDYRYSRSKVPSKVALLAAIKQEQQMMKLMGFAGFDTTKGKGVEDNKRGPAKGAISKHKEREYRQYMNRRGTWLCIHLLLVLQRFSTRAVYRSGPLVVSHGGCFKV